MYTIPRETGLVPKPHDPRTFNHAQYFGATKAYLDALPRKGLGRTPISIENQLYTNFCTLYTVSTAAEYIEGIDMSPEYQVAKLTEYMGAPPYQGAPAQPAMKSACLFGSLPKKDAPTDMTLENYGQDVIANPGNWPKELDAIAAQHKMGSFFDILRGPFDYFDNIRVALAQAKEAKEERVGMAFTQFWNVGIGDGKKIIRRGSEGYSWHAHLFIDWTEIDGEIVMIEQNSFGKGWGIEGLSYWSREAVNQLKEDNRNEVYMFRDVSANNVKEQQWTIGVIIYDLLMKISPKKAQDWLTTFVNLMLNPTPAPAPTPAPTPTPVPPPTPVNSRREMIYQEALKWIGLDASPKDQAADEVACVESLCNIVRQVMPMPDLFNTKELLEYCNKSKHWRRTEEPKRGNLIISATGTGNGKIPHGHCGIHNGLGWIMSNTSANGKWERNYSIEGWVKRYRQTGGMRLFYFEAVDGV